MTRFCLALICAAATVGAPVLADGPEFEDAIRAARAGVVKLYGGRIGQTAGYGSGVLISADGRIVTDLSVLSETPGVRAVLPDGRSLEARLIGRDEWRQLALLKVEAGDEALPHFDIEASGEIAPGEWLIAAGNPFKVADGPEPVSVSLGVLAARAPLSARRRAQDFSYDGDVLITDAIVTTPGFAGGALVNLRGALVGLVGKAVTSTNTNTFINFAYPVEEIRAFVSAVERGETTSRGPDGAVRSAQQRTSPFDLGVVLFDIGGRSPLAFVERVTPESAARGAGLRAGDLIVALDETPIGSCDGFVTALARLEPGRAVALTVKRGEDVLVIEVKIPLATETAQ